MMSGCIYYNQKYVTVVVFGNFIFLTIGTEITVQNLLNNFNFHHCCMHSHDNE